MRRTLAILTLLCLTTVAGAEPPTQTAMPTTAPAIALPAVDRMQAVIGELQLSDEQRGKVQKLLDDVRMQLQDLADLSPEDRRDTYRQVMAEARRQLGVVLSPEQQAALRDKMQVRATTEPPAAPKVEPTVAKPPAAPPAEMKPEPAKRPELPPMAGDKVPKVDVLRPRQPARVVPVPNDPPASATGAVGTPAPDFSLKRLKSGTVTLSSFANRVLVIEFGSYSAPSFRYRSAAMDALEKEYGGRAEFLTIYTAEAYPAGEWDVDRNKVDNVSIPRHADEAARLAAAESAKAILKPSRTIAVDTMDNTVARSYRAGAHSAFVIGRDGGIIARQQWCDPDGLRRYIDEATTKRLEKTDEPKKD